jgi:quinol monooxygenase YgiN
MSRILVIVQMTVKEDEVQRFLEEVEDAVLRPSNAEEGCIRYELWQSPEEPQRMVFIEEWATAEALEQHLQSAHMQVAAERIPEFLVESPVELRYIPPL